MLDTIFIIMLFALLFIFCIWGFLRLPFLHRDIREELKTKESFHELSTINRNVELEKVIGKLVRKSIDKGRFSGKYRFRIGRLPYSNVKKDFYWKYYLTFETFEGYKSFTVTKDEYNNCQKNTYGYIFFQKHRYSHFQVRNREDLHIDELIRKNQ